MCLRKEETHAGRSWSITHPPARALCTFQFVKIQAFASYGTPVWEPLPSSPNEEYMSISGSATGELLVAATKSWLWRSADGGQTWSQIANSDYGEYWTVRCNDAGTICMAALDWDPSYNFPPLYRSDDGGATWSAVASTVAEGRWRGLWCDPSGTRWIATMYSDNFDSGWLWKSVDSGLSFAKIPGTNNLELWGDAACDVSATKCVAAGAESTSQIYVSDDGFQTITAVVNSPVGLSLGVAVSADGEKTIVSQFESEDDGPRGPGFMWYSGDGGQTFQRTNAPRRYYTGVSCDAAFKMCARAANGNDLYFAALMVTSCDGGRTWHEDPGVEAYWVASYLCH